MLRLSILKTRLLFILFFLALAIPASILSYKAHEQLRWQGMHQYQLEAQKLVELIDGELQKTIEKEGARSDTDYTFFVLAGTPEARFVQRSELAKYPVESDLAGVIGYFQVDGNGGFSSPILPSAYVQSAVHPGLYGISPKENKQRNQLQDIVANVLSQNRLVVSEYQAALPKYQPQSIEEFEKSDVTAESDEFVITGSRITKESSSIQSLFGKGFSSNQSDAEVRTKNKQGEVSFSDLAISDKLKKQKANRKKSSDTLARKTEQKMVLSKLNEKRATQKRNSLKKKRNTRVEKNYSPQQSLIEPDSSKQPINRDKIKISLFESKIEPFKFSLLESGHFVMYRQVWQNDQRLIQGAVISAKEFLQNSIIDKFEQSLLYDIANLQVIYAGELLHRALGLNKEDYLSSSAKPILQSETLVSMGLSEPFGHFDLVFNLTSMPLGPGASFIRLLAFSLLLVLILGTYFLYRMTLKQANLAQQQQDFVSSVSHELKTPLTSIRMYGEILKQGWVSDDKREEYYDYIYNESERLSRLIANVLQISKVNHNALELNLEEVEISKLVSVLTSKLDSQIQQSPFTLVIQVDDSLKDQTLTVDLDAFIQIIINLVDNAIKYAQKAENKQIEIAFCCFKQSKVKVNVRDYGPGISKQHIKKIFDLFYRSEEELTRTATGTGIGLALVKELSTSMGATIEAVNQKPGVVFSLYFDRVR